MRPIKFRGKRIDNGEWIFGDLIQDTKGSFAIWPVASVNSDGMEEAAPSSIGQYTGNKDRHGNDIYEGDIITVKGLRPRVVLWDKVSWALMPCEYYNDKHFWVMNLQHPGYDWWEEFADEFEVVGNIYDNPGFIIY